MLDQISSREHCGEAVLAQRIPPLPSFTVSRALSRFDRTQLEGFISIAIDLLDLADGDPESEDDDSEDSFALPGEALANASGPGCPIADAGGDIANEDVAGGYMDVRSSGPGCPISDPGGGAVDDEAELTNEDGEEEALIGEFSDAAARAVHRTRIQRTRCFPQYRQYRDWGSREMRREVRNYRLFTPPGVPTRRQLFRRKRGVPRRPRA
ncbi:hypothetical protein [Sphingobium sp. CR28]|uniref:hypothetical protein n=1 Tax=Sphingobium sp. CR28 TaxID=3400272 RepID=UPI003FF0F0EA